MPKGKRDSTSRTNAGSDNRKQSSSSETSEDGHSRITMDHREIREWANARDAHPACVRGTGRDGDPGILRMDLPEYSGEDSLEEISWDEFFDAFEANELAFVYQEETASGEPSNFNKLVSREDA